MGSSKRSVDQATWHLAKHLKKTNAGPTLVMDVLHYGIGLH